MPRNFTKNTPNKKAELRLVEVHGNKLTTTSLIVASEFNRPHKHVLRSLDSLSSRLNIGPRDYIDSRGKTQRMYVLDERQFLIAMPFIGGEKSLDGQIRLVDEFQRMKALLSDPGRQDAIQSRRDEASIMTDMLKFVRETDGKDTNKNHYSNEHLFCNRALTGVWAPINYDDLDAYDNALMAEIRRHNQKLMTRYLKQEDRKDLMDNFVAEYRTKNPRIQLH
jgi:phage regulator Rha-like protein